MRFVGRMLSGTVGLRSAAGVIAAVAALMLGRPASANAPGLPVDWQLGMQEMVTELGRDVALFHDWLLLLITLISLFVLALLVVVVVRFNEKANPTPSRSTHNTTLEVAWTIVPVLILVAIAIPSFRVLREQLIIPPHDVVVKATGHSWYWNYEYPSDQGGFRFDSNMIPEEEAVKAGQPRLLAADNEMVVPVNKVVRLQITGADVLHNFAVPSFGIRLDAVPGRLNETWFKADREGIYYGQCSELCGNGHPYMPINVRVVSEEQYAAWLAEAKQKFAATSGDVKLAASGNR
jgi:cytochrome c oxidase subunit II